jgi:hypothetical protein
MLAYTNGGASTPSASVPSGASASISPNKAVSATMGNVGAAIASGASQMANLENTKTQNELLKAQIHQTDTQSDNIQADTANKLDENPYVRSKYANILADTLTKQSLARMNSAQTAATQQEIRIKSPEELKSQGNWGKFISPYIKDVSSAASAITKFGK